MLDQHELDAARADAQELLPDTAIVHARTQAPDGGGGRVDTYTPGPDLPARIAPIGGGEQSAGDKIDDRTTHVVTLPHDTAVTPVDRIEVAGQTYDVTAVRTRSDELVRRVEVREGA